jgi:hypothetical protein
VSAVWYSRSVLFSFALAGQVLVIAVFGAVFLVVVFAAFDVEAYSRRGMLPH